MKFALNGFGKDVEGNGSELWQGAVTGSTKSGREKPRHNTEQNVLLPLVDLQVDTKVSGKDADSVFRVGRYQGFGEAYCLHLQG
jgi:hypothetical protein